jgi:hypothetical protein
MGDRRGAFIVTVVKPEEWRRILKPRLRSDDNITLIFKKKDVGVQRIGLSQDRDMWGDFVNTGMNFQFPYSDQNFLTSWRTLSFSRMTLL